MNSRKVLVRGVVILGIVSLIFLAGCGGGAAPAVNNQPPSVASQPNGITVSPASVTVPTGAAQQFAAVVTPIGSNQAVIWSVSGTGCTGANCGTISSVGMYTAPASVPNPATVTVTATSVTDSTKSGSATVAIASPPPLATPTSTLLIEATPPAGVTVLSFSLTIMGAALEPGAVPLVKNPISVEINRLQVETSLLANLPLPTGTYNNLSLTFANPLLTILNSSGAPIGSCASGAICKLNPTLAVSSVNLTGQPFPVTSNGSTPMVLLLDFDLSKSLSASSLGSLNPVISAKQLLPADLNTGGWSAKQAFGQVVGLYGDFVDGYGFQTTSSVGSISIEDNSPSTVYVDAGKPTCLDGFYCLLNLPVESDLTVTDSAFGLSAQSTPFWLAKRVMVKPSADTELEGVIVDIGSGSQIDIVLLHEVPAAASLELGDTVRINLQSGATIEAVDTDLTRTGLLFSAPSDLLIGQVVTAREQTAPSGTPPAVTTDRVRLKSGALTARVNSILNATDFVVDNLHGNYPTGQIQVRTNTQTGFVNISGVGGLKVGDTVSVSGFLLKTTGDPVLLAEGIRKR